MSQIFSSARTRWLTLGIALAVSLFVFVSVDVGVANPGPLPGADTIVLEIEEGNNQFKYGEETRSIEVGRNNCKLDKDSPHGEIMSLDAAVVNSNDLENPVSDLVVGLVDDGLGANASGKGNGQDCGRVDDLSDSLSESLMLTLGSGISNRLIWEVDFDFEAKFDALVEVDYMLDGAVLFTEEFDLSENGSDSGPDSKHQDKYRRTGPYETAHDGALFDGVRIRMASGSVSLEGGDTWPDPSTNRTAFKLREVLGCGDSATTGGPYLDDDPRAAFYVGPHAKGNPTCSVLVDLNTETSEIEQTVNVGPPSGYTWDNVTGVVTVEWDQEQPDTEPVSRTLQRIGTTEFPIPWCEVVVGLSQASGQWFYELNPDQTYPLATGLGDVCLIFQNTETVWFDDDDNGGTPDVLRTQTTETFYIWNDPQLVRR